jgi:hypothetical protein
LCAHARSCQCHHPGRCRVCRSRVPGAPLWAFAEPQAQSWATALPDLPVQPIATSATSATITSAIIIHHYPHPPSTTITPPSPPPLQGIGGCLGPPGWAPAKSGLLYRPNGEAGPNQRPSMGYMFAMVGTPAIPRPWGSTSERRWVRVGVSSDSAQGRASRWGFALQNNKAGSLLGRLTTGAAFRRPWHHLFIAPLAATFCTAHGAAFRTAFPPPGRGVYALAAIQPRWIDGVREKETARTVHHHAAYSGTNSRMKHHLPPGYFLVRYVSQAAGIGNISISDHPADGLRAAATFPPPGPNEEQTADGGQRTADSETGTEQRQRDQLDMGNAIRNRVFTTNGVV